MTVHQLAAYVVPAWAIVAGLFSSVAVYRILTRPARARGSRIRRRPPVLLVRPVDAPTPMELENLATPIDYSGQLTHVVVCPFRPRLLSANVRWLPSDPLTRNRKVGHIAYALATLPRDKDAVVLCVDADVRVDGALVAGLIEELRNGSELASAAPCPDPSESAPGRAVRGLLVQSHHSFQVLDVMSLGAKAVCGKALAMGPAAEAELCRMGDCIGEDLELSYVMFERGLPVSMTPATAVVPQPDHVSAGAVVERFTRWMQVLRAHRPSLFPSVPLLFAPTPLLMVLATWVATPAAAMALTFLVGARIALANQLDRRPGLRFEWLLAEALLLWCWARAMFMGQVVSWRGRRYSLSAGGRMTPVPVPARGGER